MDTSPRKWQKCVCVCVCVCALSLSAEWTTYCSRVKASVMYFPQFGSSRLAVYSAVTADKLTNDILCFSTVPTLRKCLKAVVMKDYECVAAILCQIWSVEAWTELLSLLTMSSCQTFYVAQLDTMAGQSPVETIVTVSVGRHQALLNVNIYLFTFFFDSLWDMCLKTLQCWQLSPEADMWARARSLSLIC